MSKYFGNTTVASHPGRLPLSLDRLRELEPEVFTERTFKCGPICPVDHPAAEMRECIAEQLQVGDASAAIVVGLAPLVVAALGSDVDAVVLLRLPDSLAERHGLSIGSRLLCVSTYRDVWREQTRQRLYATDIVPGPARVRWSNFAPFIADFLCDEPALIEERKRGVPESEWESAARLASVRIARMGLDTARSGKPTLAGTPVRVGDLPFYGPVGSEGIVWRERAPEPATTSPGVRLLVFVLAWIVVYLFLRVSGRL